MYMKKSKISLYFKAIWLYSLFLWVYIAIENLVYPSLVYNSVFSRYIPIKTDLLGIMAFVLSFIFYILWNIYK